MIYSILVCAIVRKLFKYSNFYTKVRVFFVYFQRHFGGVLWLQIRKKQEVNNKTNRCFEKCIRTRYNYKCYIALLKFGLLKWLDLGSSSIGSIIWHLWITAKLGPNLTTRNWKWIMLFCPSDWKNSDAKLLWFPILVMTNEELKTLL